MGDSDREPLRYTPREGKREPQIHCRYSYSICDFFLCQQRFEKCSWTIDCRMSSQHSGLVATLLIPDELFSTPNASYFPTGTANYDADIDHTMITLPCDQLKYCDTIPNPNTVGSATETSSVTFSISAGRTTYWLIDE